MILFDTHAHLNDERYDPDLGDVIKRASQAGVKGMLVASYDEKSSAKAVDIANANGGVFCSVGVHPHDSKNFTDETYINLKSLIANNIEKVVAIGEIGLDYHYDHSPRETQKQVFMKQILLAHESNLPFIVHDREAHADIIAIIREAEKEGLLKENPGVFHCFSGSTESAEMLIRMGFYISFAGPLTFKNARHSVEVISRIPLDRILIETDCPYLAPEPMRGKRNEPAYVARIAEKMAEIRGISPLEASEITFANACKLFKIQAW